MTVSTDGQICYGIPFEEDFEFPWTEDGDSDEEALRNWWIYKIHGFKHDFELYDEDGEYLGGKVPSAEEKQRYYGPWQKFVDEHPLPIELVNYCSGDYPMYILAVPRTLKKNARGDAVAFSPGDLVVTEEERSTLIDFCQLYEIEMPSEPKWYLSSVWM